MDIYFLPEYANLYADGDTTPEVFDFECEHGRVHYSFLRRRIDFKGDIYYDITTPYGYGGPVVAGCHTSEAALISSFDEAFTNYCVENRIVSEFVRFHPVIKNH
ncbi:MAG: GNAT family N-acetyltransferase, partial [Clostridiales bacterium]|nr:GNAT family N-acetyltransferase [Clostridiales bacterium]